MKKNKWVQFEPYGGRMYTGEPPTDRKLGPWIELDEATEKYLSAFHPRRWDYQNGEIVILTDAEAARRPIRLVAIPSHKKSFIQKHQRKIELVTAFTAGASALAAYFSF